MIPSFLKVFTLKRAFTHISGIYKKIKILRLYFGRIVRFPKRILKMACNTVATYELFLQLFSKFWQDFESFLCFGTDIPQHYTSEVLENHSISCCVSACHVHYTFTPQIVQSPMTLDKLQQNCGFRLFVDFKTSITKNCKCF